MAKYELAVWPQDKYRFALFDNAQGLQTTNAVLAAHPGAVGAINLWYFSMVDQPAAGVKKWDHQNGGVKLRGKWAYEKYDFPGLCIDKDGYMSVGGKANAVWDYTACVQADYIDGLRTNTKAWPRNGVTYTGQRADGAWVGLVASTDNGLTSQEAVNILLAAGCVTILRWDGSWSSQGQLLPGQVVKPSQHRAVRGWLIIYPRDNDKKEDKPVDGIKQGIMTRSDCYKAGKTITPKGIMVHSTATPGKMAKALRDDWDAPGVEKAVNAFIDPDETIQALPWNWRGWHAGGKANDTHISFEICEPQECRLLPIEWVTLRRGSSGWAVTRLQMELQARGYDPKGVDGSFGPGCEAGLKACQSALGLAADGSCGPATLAALAKRTGSYLAYRPENTANYFAAVWARAVALCAMLCKEYALDPVRDILCHSEGYKAGIASNHADVMHWFPQHGRSMDDFRRAVKEAMAPVEDYREAVKARFGFDDETVGYLAAYKYGPDLLRKLATQGGERVEGTYGQSS